MIFNELQKGAATRKGAQHVTSVLDETRLIVGKISTSNNFFEPCLLLFYDTSSA